MVRRQSELKQFAFRVKHSLGRGTLNHCPAYLHLKALFFTEGEGKLVLCKCVSHKLSIVIIQTQ